MVPCEKLLPTLLCLINICVAGDVRLQEYISTSRDRIVDEFVRHVRHSKDYQRTVLFHEEITKAFEEDIQEAHYVTLFGEPYLLTSEKLLNVTYVNEEMILTERLNFDHISTPVDIVKTFDHNGLAIVSVVSNGTASIYAFNHVTFAKLQTIKTRNKITDLVIFSQASKLYMVITTMLKDSLAPIIVYEWEGSYFDEVNKIHEEGAFKIQNFRHFDLEIIIILRNNDGESNSYVYEFESGLMRKVQVLDTTGPTHIETYVLNEQRYVIVFDGERSNKLYRWYSEMIPIQTFNVAEPIEKHKVVSYHNQPILFLAFRDALEAYSLEANLIRPIEKINFTKSFTSITSLQSVNRGDDLMLVVIGANKQYAIIPYNIQDNEIENQVAAKSELQGCLETLEDKIENIENNLGKVGTAKEFSNSSLKQRRQFVPTIDEQILILWGENEFLRSRIDNVKTQLGDLLFDNSSMIVYGKLIIMGGINAVTLVSENLHLKKLNAIVWTPMQWLSYSQNQSLSGSVSVTYLQANNVLIPHEDNIFKDILLSDGDQIISSPVKLNTLSAKEIESLVLNDMSVDDLYLKASQDVIKGNKTFNNVYADEAIIHHLNKQNCSDVIKLFGDPMAIKYDFSPRLKVRSLFVDKINGVDFNLFSQNVFRIGGEQKIAGQLVFDGIKSVHLFAKTLAGMEVDHMLTVDTNQTVDSTIVLSNADAPNVICNKLNGIYLEKDAAIFGQDRSTTIHGPVTIKKIHIRGNVSMNGTAYKLSELFKRNRIAGTNEADLLQIYQNKVKISGNLHLQSVQLPHSARLFISGNEFNHAHFNEYWLKTANQEIPVHFETQQGLSTPHLNAKLLNNVPMADYMQNNEGGKRATVYVFENVTVNGDVVLDKDRSHHPNLQKLTRDAVRFSGSYSLRGNKKFKGKLFVGRLKADIINSESTETIANVKSTHIAGSNIFDNVVVTGNVKAANITSKTLNSIVFQKLGQDMIFIDRPISMENLTFFNVTANHLAVSKVNNRLLSDYALELEEINSRTSLSKLIVKGNSTFRNLNKVFAINNVNIMQRFDHDKSKDGIDGKVSFQDKVYVKHLFASNVNDVNYVNLLPRLFYRYWVQNITIVHKFKILTAPNIYTNQINNINTENLINTDTTEPQELWAQNGLRCESATFGRSLKTDKLECEFTNAVAHISDPPTRNWRKMTISGSTFLSNDNQLHDILTHNLSFGDNVTITAPVTFGDVHANNVFARKNINNVDLGALIHDTITKSSNDVVISGFKEFANIVTENVLVMNNADIPVINNIDLAKINASIVDKRPNLLIRGTKTMFSGLQTTSLQARDILSENIVTLTDLHRIDNATFDSLEIKENFKTEFVNEHNFTNFLEDRLLLKSDEEQIINAIYYVDELVLNDETTISSINDIQISDLVFDEGVQTITSPKTFAENVNFDGDVVVEDLNGFRVDDLYNQAILASEDANIMENIAMNNLVEIMVPIEAQTINGVSVKALKNMMENQNPQIRTDIINDKIMHIEQLIGENLEIIKRLPDQYNYIEKSNTFQINVPNSVSAQVVYKDNNVMVHIRSEEESFNCGLPNGCSCPNQHTMQFSSGYSINEMDNKYNQRVFTFQNKFVNINLVTNTKSVNNFCRSNSTDALEYSTISWTRTKVRNGTGGSFSHPQRIYGYISDVNFFTFAGDVYVIVSRYYDLQSQSHDVAILVLKLDMLQNKIEDVQSIAASAVWTIHVFYTSDGIILVHGSKDHLLGTRIYRLHPMNKKFELIRSIPSLGCTSVASMVSGYESFIILAHERSPYVTVLKYKQKLTNYYEFQNIAVEYPVRSISVFYLGGVGISEPYLTVITEHSRYYIFSYKYVEGWIVVSSGNIAGIRGLVPFTLNKAQYFLATAKNQSLILDIVKNGYH